ncbi:MAG: hypothetical protein WBE34_12290 [Candidatus Nitrosopolaris sp.]
MDITNYEVQSFEKVQTLGNGYRLTKNNDISKVHGLSEDIYLPPFQDVLASVNAPPLSSSAATPIPT